MGEDDLYTWLMGLNGSGGMDSSNTDFSNLSSMQDGGFGMNDRGLGTSDPNMSLPGQATLSPGAIASLGTPSTGNLASLGSGGSAAGGANPLAQFGGLAGLMTLLAPLLGGVMSSSASKDAAAQQQAAAQKANDNALALMGGGAAAFKPYQDMGAAAMGKAGGMNWSPMAGRFADVQAGPALGPQYQSNAALLGPRFSSPGPSRMATLAGLGGSKNG